VPGFCAGQQVTISRSGLITITDRIPCLLLFLQPFHSPLQPVSIKDILPQMSQNPLEVVENLHAAVSADPDNTDHHPGPPASTRPKDEEMGSV
jgi:hypothetical protein